MENNNIEPGLLRIFRYFTGVAMIYFAALVGYTAIQTGEGDSASQIQSYLNFGINLALLGYLYWGWLQRRLKQYYLPIALLAATVVPIFSNLIYLAEPLEAADLRIMRSWLLFPILMVPLVLIAWQYHFRYVIVAIIFSTGVDLAMLWPKIGVINLHTVPILGVPFFRAFSFGIVGNVVSHLIAIQRAQRKKLLRANVQLSQHANTLEQLATSRERNRLARELHDTLAHTLSGLTVNLEAIKIILGKNQHEVHTMLDHALENTRTGLTETRRALKDLRAKRLEDLGLSIAIRDLARNAASRSDFQLVLDIEMGINDIPQDIEQCFFRIAQETLENIVKHAKAQNVHVRLKENQDLLTLIIDDDGIGFDPDGIDFIEKMGIKGIYERASVADAHLEIDSHPQEGTHVQLIKELVYDQSLDL